MFAPTDTGNYQGYDARQHGDEAQEDEGYADDVEANEYAGNSEDDDGEDILENMDRDYEHRPELDRYDARGIDDQLQQELSLDGRAHAEEDLAQQDRYRQAGRRPNAFMANDDDLDDEEEVLQAMKQERMRMMMRDDGGDANGLGAGSGSGLD